MIRILVLGMVMMLGWNLGHAQTFIETAEQEPTGYLSIKQPYYYASKDGVLYIFSGKNPRVLVRFPSADTRASFTVPPTVDRIARGAFKGCYNLKEIILPASLLYVGENAFEDTEIESFKVEGNDMSGMTTMAPDIEPDTSYYTISGQMGEDPASATGILIHSGEKVMKR